jgi:hypothetical protein
MATYRIQEISAICVADVSCINDPTHNTQNTQLLRVAINSILREDDSPGAQPPPALRP